MILTENRVTFLSLARDTPLHNGVSWLGILGLEPNTAGGWFQWGLGHSVEQYGYNYALKITSCDAFNFTSLFSVNSLSQKHLVICFDGDNLTNISTISNTCDPFLFPFFPPAPNVFW